MPQKTKIACSFWVGFFLSLTQLLGQGFSKSSLSEAYSHVFKLEYQEAILSLDSLKSSSTGKCFALHLENYIDFLKVICSGSEEQYEALAGNKAPRLAKLAAIQDADAKKYRDFVSAEVELQWAVLDARFHHYFSAYTGAVSAYKRLERNLEDYPEFKLSQKSLALCHALVGAIPKEFRWGFKLLSGMGGSIQQGLKEIDEVIAWCEAEKLPYLEECIVAKSYMLLHLAEQDSKAVQTIETSGLDPAEGPLACLIYANIALRTQNSQEATRVLNEYLALHGKYEVPYMYFLRGLSRIQNLDYESYGDFKLFLDNHKGEDYKREALQKMAWSNFLAGDIDGYRLHMDMIKNTGKNEVGGDQNATQESKRGVLPNMTLLKVRLLYDGGFCAKAKALLDGYAISDFQSEYQKTELIYRQGRIAQCLDDAVSAVIYFNQAMVIGKDISGYYACNSALQIGLIFEEMGRFDGAVEYFDACLSMNPADYSRSLHAKATAGLKRIESKRN